MARKSEFKRAKQRLFSYNKTKKHERGFRKKDEQRMLNEICPKDYRAS